MKISAPDNSSRINGNAREKGAILIIVLWISFGLVSVTLYFGHSMIMDFKAADNMIAGIEAEQTIDGAARYLLHVLGTKHEPGQIPDWNNYECEEAPVDRGLFWLIGRPENSQAAARTPVFSLIDEAGKLNLNTATVEMLQMLPNMTPDLAASIVDWRDPDDDITPGGAESETYMRHNPPYSAKNGPFETVGELRLVRGADWDLLHGRDRNRNGVIDFDELNASRTASLIGGNSGAEFGLLEWVTVHSREPNKRAGGSPATPGRAENNGTESGARLNANTASEEEIRSLVEPLLSSSRATQIAQRLTTGNRNYQSLLEIFLRTQLTPQEFIPLSDALTHSDDEFLEGLININTAGRDVLACLPGVGLENADRIIAYRQSYPDQLQSVAWITQALEPELARATGPYITTRSYQFTADIAAVGRDGRGYRRVLFVFDTSGEAPKIIYRRDLSHLGWALGPEVRQRLAQTRPGIY
jgi:DNA uptake protein ComE-like DNA-binding protein